ncbi:LacI family DNA-binding transcriptional regulator [Pseudactinotalea terrae]|uniref:LacI family DNA-binding transcriptional regulator n=1 Tax=Pseudactinotalea terrae TaxID=1743262 RepID=UPI0012E1459B|nr:LacI family DNA-binding transcriptional regulator [Pseudactinotalea terrae]
MGATIKDVARLAGVSIKTVSNVLHGYQYLTDETKSRVERALVELDYRPNIAARNLRRGRSGVIALALPSLDNPYFAEMANRIVKEAVARDLTVLVDATEGDLDREALVAEGFRSRLLDGIILQPWSISDEYLHARTDPTPLVLLGERGLSSADGIAIDSRAAAYAAVEHLIGLGRQRIAAIGARPRKRSGSWPTVEPGRRMSGYESALTDHGLPVDAALVAHPGGDHTPEVVARAIGELLQRAPDLDAIFAFNDRVALGAIRALATRGVKVPDDVAVIGIDDIEASRLSTPSLSSIAPDKAGIARTAIEMLVERIDGGAAAGPARHVVADFELIVRESTGGQEPRTGQPARYSASQRSARNR